MSAITLNERQQSKIMSFLRSCNGIYVGNEAKTLRFIAAILWLVRSGSQWELLPASYGKWNSVYKRFARWCKGDIFTQMHAHFAADPDLECLLLDSTIIRAHPCAAGAPGPTDGETAVPQALGRSRGGFSTKIHIVVDALGNPLDFVLTAGQVRDVTQAPALLQGRRTDYVIADKGYDATALLELIEQLGAIPIIPARKNRSAPRDLDTHLYKECHLIECFINKIKMVSPHFFALRQAGQAFSRFPVLRCRTDLAPLKCQKNLDFFNDSRYTAPDDSPDITLL